MPKQNYAIPAAIVIAGAIIGVSLYFGLSQRAPATTGQGGAKVAVDIKDVKVGPEDPYIGQQNAPVTLAYWSDYQCPFCKAVEVGGIPQIKIEPSIPTIIKEYVDTGKVRIVFKDYPFLGEDSITAALYEHAIWEKYPDKFYTWREKMYESQDDEGDQGFGDETSILQLISTIPGMDGQALKALVAKNKDQYMTRISADRDEGSALGVQGTPAFITGKTMIDGAQPLANFKAAIDAQL